MTTKNKKLKQKQNSKKKKKRTPVYSNKKNFFCFVFGFK